MENFESLPAEKQDAILNAALETFGRNGYKKASMNDIAAAAGVSKAAMFYYFGTKKGLYHYLARLCSDVILSAIETRLDSTSADFFQRLRAATAIKMDTVRQYPALLAFTKSLFAEKDGPAAEIKGELAPLREKYADAFLFTGADTSRFKPGVEPRLIFKFAVWASEGFLAQLPPGAPAGQTDAFVEEFYASLSMMERHFCKEAAHSEEARP